MMANAEEYPLFSSQMVTDHRANTFRSVYTVRFTDRVFVLHAFQKRAKSGIATPKSEIELLEQRLSMASRLVRLGPPLAILTGRVRD
jgi:hypothetical protein